MGWGRLLPLVGVGLLLLIVPLAMCVGLRDEPPPPSTRAPPRLEGPERTEAEQPLDAEAPFDAEAPDEEVPVAEGLREIAGTVHGLDDEPLEGIEVLDEGARRRDVTDRDGRYRLRRVGTAPTAIVVRAPGYAEARLAVARGEIGERGVVDVFLEAGDTVGGRVIDAAGRRVVRATVRCADRHDDALRAESDGYGRFELPARAAGCAGVAEEQGQEGPRVTLVRGPDNLLELPAPASIAGVVVDAAGQPVRTFLLSIESYRAADGSAKARSYRQTFSHPQGRFTMSNVEAGTYVLSVSAPRLGPARSEAVVVEPGAQVDGVRIVLR